MSDIGIPPHFGKGKVQGSQLHQFCDDNPRRRLWLTLVCSVMRAKSDPKNFQGTNRIFKNVLRSYEKQI